MDASTSPIAEVDYLEQLKTDLREPPYNSTANRQALLPHTSIESSSINTATVLDKQTILCGLFTYRPRWLQCFARKECALFWICWFCLVQGIVVNGLVPSILSTIERRFDFTSLALGRITQSYDIGYVLFCIPVSYLGGRHSKPVFLGVGITVMAIGSFIFSLPHLVSTSYSYQSEGAYIGSCEVNISFSRTIGSMNCSESQGTSEYVALSERASNTRYEALFCAGQFLHGIGATPLFTLGVSYIDENVGERLSPLFIGIFYTFAIIGPAFGFLLSTWFLRFHTDYFWMQAGRSSDLAIDEHDINWVGAWWCSFLLTSIMASFAIFPILSLPKVLPTAFDWFRNTPTPATPADDTYAPVHLGQSKSASDPMLPSGKQRTRSDTNEGHPERSTTDKGLPVLVLKDVSSERSGGSGNSHRRTPSAHFAVVPSHRDSVVSSDCEFPHDDDGDNHRLKLKFKGEKSHANADSTDGVFETVELMARTSAGGVPRSEVSPRRRCYSELATKTRLSRKESVKRTIWHDCSAVPVSLKKLLENKCFLFITLAASVDAILITGLSTFMPKYLEGQFSLNSTKANTLIGSIMVPVAGIATLLSGFVVKRFNLSAMHTIKLCIAMGCISLILTPMFLVYCDPKPISGVDSNYPISAFEGVNRTAATEPIFDHRSSCNDQCSCLDVYNPVCATVGNSSYTMLSPCFAGCPGNISQFQMEYHHCSCVGESVTVKRGACEDTNCAYLVLFCILLVPTLFCTFSIGVPLLTVVLRTVDHSERSFALGIQWILIRCIGTIPAPALFGFLFDKSCVSIKVDQCTPEDSSLEKGQCYVYDRAMLSNVFLLFGILGQLGTVLFLILALVYHKRQPDVGNAESELKETE